MPASEKGTSYRSPNEGKESMFNAARDLVEQDGNVLFAYVFGSVVAGRMRGNSDVDIAVFMRGA